MGRRDAEFGSEDAAVHVHIFLLKREEPRIYVYLIGQQCALPTF